MSQWRVAPGLVRAEKVLCCFSIDVFSIDFWSAWVYNHDTFIERYSYF